MEETHEEYLAKRLDGSLERLAYASLPTEPKVDQKDEEKEPEAVIKVKINEVSRRNHLFHKYSSQSQPQSCHIELDCRLERRNWERHSILG